MEGDLGSDSRLKEIREERMGSADLGEIRAVANMRSLDLSSNQARLAEDLEVPGNRGLGQGEVFHNCPSEALLLF